MPLTAITQGMVLGKAVKDEQGRILCGIGTKLTDRLIQRFDSMGILTLFIETTEKLSATEIDNLKNSIKKRFVNVSNTSLTKHIEHILLKRIDQDMS